MIKKFKKEFLREVLGLAEEEVKLVLECQRLFPELLENDAQEIKSTRKMYLDLGLSESHWSKWSKKNIIENEFFKENVDWRPLTLEESAIKSRAEGNFAKDYIISIEFAKHLCMMARTENSHKFRQYFILIEKSIRGRQEHLAVREPEKENYNRMKAAIISDYCNRHDNVTEYDKNYLMIRESNMINMCLTGLKANEIRSKLGYRDIQTREHLEIQINKGIDEMQLMITGLVVAGIDFEARSKIIKNICDSKYSHLKLA